MYFPGVKLVLLCISKSTAGDASVLSNPLDMGDMNSVFAGEASRGFFFEDPASTNPNANPGFVVLATPSSFAVPL